MYIIGRDKNSDIQGVGEITVEYKLTHGLSKVYHIERIYTSASLSADVSGQFRVELEKFLLGSLKSLGSYKSVFCESNTTFMQQDELAGFKFGQVYM